ncbi:MAG: hypothetical protein AB1625_13125 [Acidobacteriota bacterium]
MRHRGSLAAVSLLALALASCGEDVLDAETDLVVLNDSACDLTIFVDGREAFTVPAGSDLSLDDIGPGRHVLEALDARGGLVMRRSIELASGEDYYWILHDC